MLSHFPPVQVIKLPTTPFLLFRVLSTYLDQWLAFSTKFPRECTRCQTRKAQKKIISKLLAQSRATNILYFIGLLVAITTSRRQSNCVDFVLGVPKWPTCFYLNQSERKSSQVNATARKWLSFAFALSFLFYNKRRSIVPFPPWFKLDSGLNQSQFFAVHSKQSVNCSLHSV